MTELYSNMRNCLIIMAFTLFLAALGLLASAARLGRKVARAHNEKKRHEAERLENKQLMCLKLAPVLTGGAVGALAAVTI